MDFQSLDGIALEVVDFEITECSPKDLDALAFAFVMHGLLVIRNQKVAPLKFAQLCHSVGPLQNVSFDPFEFENSGQKIDDLPVHRITGASEAKRASDLSLDGRLEWHSDYSNHHKAFGLGLQALSAKGADTQWMYSPNAYRDLSEELKLRLNNAWGQFMYNYQSWAPDLNLEEKARFEKTQADEVPYTLPLEQRNPGGLLGIYLHFHNQARCQEDPSLIEELREHCYQDRYIYNHQWKEGDIVLSDQIITTHRRVGADISERLLHRYTFFFDRILLKTKTEWQPELARPL